MGDAAQTLHVVIKPQWSEVISIALESNESYINALQMFNASLQAPYRDFGVQG